ncbi:myosin-10 [Nasonia vitripennis]|uniref:Dynein regulatory complex protein 10 n=1 Tax=Nasonia vitripennis TaxID=7425 RepID=A0A7M7Q5F3_NASVI|nr:myosin-10 [Nasonia vitripennis]
MNIREEIIDRMLRILKQFTRKLKIAIYLPIIIEQLKTKRPASYRNVKEFRKLYTLCTSAKLEANQQGEMESLLTNNESKQVATIQEEPADLESQCAVILQRLIDYEDDILSVAKDNIELILPSLVNTINRVELLEQIVDLQVRTTPKQLREREIGLRNADTLIAQTQEEIQTLRSSIEEETSKHEETIKKCQDEIAELNLLIDDRRRKHRAELERQMNRYETKLRGLRDDIIDEKHNLDLQLYANEGLMEQLIQADLEREKSLRNYCVKSERKRIAARCAYDRDLKKLNELKETLEMQLRVTKTHFEISKNEYDVQSVLFTNLKKQRELAMMQAFAEQLDNFEKNRAARIIQRTWRAYHERCISSKKRKKKKNK